MADLKVMHANGMIQRNKKVKHEQTTASSHRNARAIRELDIRRLLVKQHLDADVQQL